MITSLIIVGLLVCIAGITSTLPLVKAHPFPALILIATFTGIGAALLPALIRILGGAL